MNPELNPTYHWLQGAIISKEDHSKALAEAEEVIKPNSRQTAARRLEVYQSDYFGRIRSVLAMDYEGTSALLGTSEWNRLCDRFASEQPSTFKNIDHYGDNFPAFLAASDVPNASFLRDLALLERTVSKLFSLPEETPLERGALQTLAPEDWESAGLKVRKGLHVLELAWPANSWLNRFNEATEADEAIPAVPTKAEVEYVQVYRKGLKVWRQTLNRPRALLLLRLMHGEALGTALEAASEAWQEPEEDFAPALQNWFADWMEDGVFTAITRPSG